MPEVIAVFFVVILILGFAFFGFIKFLRVVFGSGETESDRALVRNDENPRTFGDDIVGTSHLLNHLLASKQIDAKTYSRIRKFLEHRYGDKFKLVNQIGIAAEGGEDASLEKPQGSVTSSSQPRQSSIAPSIVNDGIPDKDVEIVSSSSAIPSDSTAAEKQASSATPVTATVQSSTQRPAGRAPWDMPDPPVHQPRRTFGELMSGFMLEKNIRWGELTSGILIVGSAVGLVVSLRNELRDTIPYFSALLFLLITAAIHGAGIYTLKKWKLRNTSRGTLLIGLLLIPLNIVAACILTGNETDRRELTDPLLWIATTVGLSSFAAMTWFSGKCLFRRGQLPMVIAVVGCAIGTLLINRVENLAGSSVRKMLVTIPLALSFLVGTAAFYKRQWVRVRWPERTTNRLFVFLGICSFALFAAASMLIVRSQDKSAAVVALTPVFSTVCLMTTWLGRVVWQGAIGREQKRLQFTGLTLHILGLGLVAASLLFSAANPTVLLVNSVVVAVGMILCAKHQQEPRLLAAAWTAFAAFVLCAVNLSIGDLSWDAWASLNDLGGALFNGQSGLSLLATGAGIIGVHSLYQRRSKNKNRFRQVGLFSGAAISGTGCLLALVASFVNPENRFDVMTATALLGLASVISLGLCVIGRSVPLHSNRDSVYDTVLSLAAAVIAFAFLSHAFGWNRTIFNWLNDTSFGINANWILIFSGHSLLLALVAVLSRFESARSVLTSGSDAMETTHETQSEMPLSLRESRALRSGEGARSAVTDVLGESALATGTIGWLGVFFLVHHQTGLATAIAIALSAGWLLLVWVQQKHRFGIQFWTGLFTIATSLSVIVFVSELLTKTEWCPEINQPRHFLIQSIALSIWAAVWFGLTWLLGRRDALKKFTDFHPRVEWLLALGLTAGLSTFLAISLLGESRLELIANAKESILPLVNDKRWVFASLAGIGLALSMAIFKKPLEVTGGALIAVWFLTWGFGAEFFADTRSVGTALRWLLPIGGAFGAVLVASRKPLRPVWAVARNRCGLGGRSTWSSGSTQTLINIALAFVAFVVLCISTIAITRFLMTGSAAALGGPEPGSWFGNMKKDISYGGPVGIMVGNFLLYAISERRKWLATAGSAVFQYCVVMAVILLFLSPHPKLASSWFVNILQAVSIGMTAYGFCWYFFRERIEGLATLTKTNGSPAASHRLSQIEVHTLINGLLISALAVLVMIRFYAHPDVSGDWINTVGGALGLLAWAAFGGLAFTIWRVELNQPHRTSTWMWLACWLGLVLVGMVAAFVDRQLAAGVGTIPWLTFQIIMWGATLVCFSQVILLWLERRPELVPGVYREKSTKRFKSIRSDQTIPLLFAGTVVSAFAVRGILLNPSSFWIYFTALATLVGFLTVAGLMRQSAWLAFISAGVTTLAITLLVSTDPNRWFSGQQPYFANVLSLALSLLAFIWSGFYVYRTRGKGEGIRPAVVWMPNLVLLLSSVWILLGGLAEWLIQTAGIGNASSLGNLWGAGAVAAPLLLGGLHFWNDGRKFQVVSGWLWLTGLFVFGLVVLVPGTGLRNASIAVGLSAVVAIFGMVWANRESLFVIGRKLHAPKLIRLERSMDWQFPVFAMIIGFVVLVWAFAASLIIDGRPERYLSAMSPLGLALGLGCMSDQTRRRWLQLATLCLLTVAAVLVAWADLTPLQVDGEPMRLFVRALLVLAGAMFVYGGLVSRWVREGDTWLQSLREMTIATCVLALPCFAMVLFQEFAGFVPDVGCGMPLTEAVAVSVVVIGMMVGLILISVLPKHDPFSLSLVGRMGYVYVGQVVGVMLLVHVYLTMPFLFQIGILDYWPYIAMALCFGGVAVAHILEKRELTVLGQPLFHTAAVLPVLVAAFIWAIDSKADVSLVMLTVGMAYLMISYLHNSILSGAAAILFGNLALWLFYEKFDGFSFLEHPQLWLIPPALSMLVAAQIAKNSFTRQQLALIRYICVAIIYLSSTSEIFITGLGQKLWPPVILAMLAIGGIMAGIMLQIRAFLYLGSLFLLMAMISMVSHAHQRLEHVWPWWTFGIGTGIAILVMFGLFEKRKNDMKEVAGRLSQWDL